MNLTEYQRICAGLDNLCTYAWGGAPDGAELLEWATALEEELTEEHKAHGRNLAESCRELVADYARKGMKRSGALRESVAGYRQHFANYRQLSPLVDDLESGEIGNYTEAVRKSFISALNRLYSICWELSGVCFEEFDKYENELLGFKRYEPRKEPQKTGEGKTVPELIESTPGALAIVRAVAGYLTNDYKPKVELSTLERGVIGWALGRALGWGYIAKVGEYWGVPGKDLSRDKGDADKNYTNSKLTALKELLRGCGLVI